MGVHICIVGAEVRTEDDLIKPVRGFVLTVCMFMVCNYVRETTHHVWFWFDNWKTL